MVIIRISHRLLLAHLRVKGLEVSEELNNQLRILQGKLRYWRRSIASHLRAAALLDYWLVSLRVDLPDQIKLLLVQYDLLLLLLLTFRPVFRLLRLHLCVLVLCYLVECEYFILKFSWRILKEDAR